MESVPDHCILDQPEQCSRQRISILANTVATPSSSTTLCQPTALKNKVHTKTEEIQYQKIHLSPRLPRNIISKSVWQVQLEGRVQHEGITEKLVADEMMMEPKISDFKIYHMKKLTKTKERVGCNTLEDL